MMPGTSHTEITNEAGNWNMGDGPGKEGVAFLLTGNAVPIDTVGMQQSYEKEAEGIESADDHSTIEVSDGGDAEKPVLSITRTKQAINGFSASTVYEIDPATGRLLSTLAGGIRQEFDLGAVIDESAFEVPKSLVVAPVSDVVHASEYLYNHK